jgi:hypothetical protein
VIRSPYSHDTSAVSGQAMAGVSYEQPVSYGGVQVDLQAGARSMAPSTHSAPCTQCGARLARDNTSRVCTPCQRRARLTAADPAFWRADPIRSAVATQDMISVIAAFRQHPGHGLRPLPQRLVAAWRGVSQAQVSRLEKRENKIDSLSGLTAWADALLMPTELRWWQADTSGVSAAAPVPATLELDDQGGGDDVRRRDMLRLTGIVVAADSLIPAPWERLAASLRNPAMLDDSTLNELERRTNDFFLREETTPARALIRDLAAHGDMIGRLSAGSSDPRTQRRLLSVQGETEALTGWLLFDMGKNGAALKRYDSARRAAQGAGDGPLLACVLGYMSYMAETQDDPEEARSLLIEAQHHAIAAHSAGTRSWLAAREAEISATLGDTSSTDRALERAFVAFDYASPHRERPWTSFFNASRMGSMAVSSYVRLRHHALESTAASVLESLSAGENKVRAIVYADLATAAAEAGDFERALDLVSESLDTAMRTETSVAKHHLSDLAARLPTDENSRYAKVLRELLATSSI